MSPYIKLSDYRDKPEKPYPDFPLFAHANGCWAKKIRGRLHYFGPWTEPDGALAKYLAEKDALHAGRKATPAAATVKDTVNAFLNAKQALVDAGELTPRSWSEYKESGDVVVSCLGKARLVSDLAPDDFASLRRHMAHRWGPVRLGNAIQRIRSIFKYAADAGLIDRPVRFGPGFTRPTKKTLRLHRAAQGPKLFSPDDIHKLLAASDPQMKAMIMLGINCGYGPSDCGALPLTALDLEHGVIDFPRPKTGIARRCTLWPETVQAIHDALSKRVKPRNEEDAGLAFTTARGGRWHKETGGSYASWTFGGMLKKLGLNARKGLGFYTLRHVFRTVADEAKDQPAADYIMGHESPHMSSHYRERISDERLRAVTDHGRAWLYAQPPEAAGLPLDGEEE